MARIEKKVWPEYFAKILSGDKTFELRLADWNCEVGDILVLKEWEPARQVYTGREIEKKITYVLKTKDQKLFKPEDVEKYGFQVIGFK